MLLASINVRGVVWFPLTTWASRQQLNHYQAHFVRRFEILAFCNGTTPIVVVSRWFVCVAWCDVAALTKLTWDKMHREPLLGSCYIFKRPAKYVYFMMLNIYFFAYSLIYLLCGRLFGVIFVTYSKSSIDFYLPFKNIQYWNSWNLPLFPFHHFRRTISWNFQFYVQFCIVAARIQRSFFFSFFLLCIANVFVLVSMCFSISFSVGCLYFIHICLVVDLNKKHAHFSLVALLDFALSLCVCMLNM